MTKIKVCGIKNQEQAGWCEDLAMDFIGFIFHPPSPRFVQPEAAAAISTRKPLRVGVFVHQDLDAVKRIMDQARLDLIQLHGGQDADFCKKLGPERVIKVFWPESFTSREELVLEMDRFAEYCSWFLLDAGTSGGGHGKPMNWDRLGNLRPPRPWLLAGGLAHGNALAAVRACRPDAVDLNTGVERSPGNKDLEQMQRAVEIIRGFQSSDTTKRARI